MKNLVIVIMLGVAGYFGYQYVTGSSPFGSKPAPPAFNMFSLPENCQRAGEAMKNAFYRHMNGELVTANVNGYKKTFRSCLRREGYTTSEIDEAYKGIADSADYNR